MTKATELRDMSDEQLRLLVKRPPSICSACVASPDRRLDAPSELASSAA